MWPVTRREEGEVRGRSQDRVLGRVGERWREGEGEGEGRRVTKGRRIERGREEGEEEEVEVEEVYLR